MPEDFLYDTIRLTNSFKDKLLAIWGWQRDKMEENTMTGDVIYGYDKSVLAEKQECKCPKAARQKLISLKCGNCNNRIHIHGGNTAKDIDVIVCGECGTKGDWFI